jgi:hypothetical protein
LSDGVSASNEAGDKPGQYADRSAYESRPQLHRPSAQPICGRHCCKQRAIVGDGQEAREGSEDEVERSRRGVVVGQHGDAEVRRVAEQHARHRDGSRRGAEGGDRDSVFEPLYQFLKNEDGPRDRSVESSGETSASPGRNQHPAAGPGSAEQSSYKVSEARPHLDAGALAAERQAGADREQSAQEFHRDQEKRSGWKFPRKTAST